MMRRLAWVLPLLLLAATAAKGERVTAPVPLDGPHHYRVTWLGMHCGDMTLESAPVEGKPAMVQMVMTVRSTELFDGIYKVRSRIESTYNHWLGSTRRYHEKTSEKGDEKEDVWLVDARNQSARRTKNGKVEDFELPPGGVHDPLAMLYRFRALAREAGDEAALTVMTTRGAVEARAVAERWERFETPLGEVDALKVVQERVEDEQFGRGGAMTLWLSNDSARVPYRIEFDLPFGKLVAELAPEPEAAQKTPSESQAEGA